jgi:polysaccharide biosynthesis transport protein
MDFSEYIDILRRRRWLAIIPIVIISTMTTFVGFMTPNKYTSTMLLAIEETLTEDRLLQGLIAPTDASSRLSVINETISSESFSQRLVSKLRSGGRLGPETDWSNIESSIRSNARVEMITRSIRPKANDLIIRITLTMTDRIAVPIVLQGIAEGFIEESTRPQKEAARTANEFLRKQLQDFDKELAETESKLQAFKESNTDALPGAYQNSIDQLNQLKRQEADIEISHRELVEKRNHLVAKLVEENPQRMRLQNELAQAVTKYTDQHPLVRNLSEQLRKLEAMLAEEQKKYQETGQLNLSHILPVSGENLERMITMYGNTSRPAESAGAETRVAATGTSGNGMDALTELTLGNVEELQQTDRQLNTMQARLQALHEAIDKQTRITYAIPAREREYTALVRNYDGLQARYNKAYQRLQEAKLSEELDYLDSLQRFNILQKPRAEGTPVQTPKVKLLMIGLIAALVSGMGLAFVAEFFDSAIQSVSRVNPDLHLQILGKMTNQFKQDYEVE